MPVLTTHASGAPCWIDLMSADPARATDFYSTLFGWTSETAGEEFGGYINFSKNGQLVAGCAGKQDPTMPDAWTVYLATTDATATVAKSEPNGGQVAMPAMEVSDIGTMAILIDAGGAFVGAWKPGTHKGFGLLGEPGAPAWFEVLTRAYEPTLKYYQNVFGWETSSMEGAPFQYATLGSGPTAAAGIMDASSMLPEGVPPHWSVYFQTADCDAAVATVTKLGGSVVMPAEDTGFGRLATVTDPMGAAFRLLGRP
jgi:uncharacterized protein